MSAVAASERWKERRSDDELVFGGEIKECESVIASLLRALLHFIDSYHGHNSKNLLPTLWAVSDTCDERWRERSGGLGGKDKDGKCVHDSKWRWNGLEGAEELHTALGSLVLLTLCAGVRLLWKPPLYIPYTKVSMVTGPSLVTLGLPLTHSVARFWVAARRLGILQRPSCHSHITFPWEPTPVAHCEVVMETAHGQVAEDKWGDVRVSGRRLKRPVLYLRRGAFVRQTPVVCHTLMQLQTREGTYDGCRSAGQLGRFITRLPVWHVPRLHAMITALWDHSRNGDL